MVFSLDDPGPLGRVHPGDGPDPGSSTSWPRSLPASWSAPRARPRVAVRPRGDVDEPAGLPEGDLVPDALRHDHGITGADLDEAVAVGQLQFERDGAGHEEQELVAVRVDLPVVGSVA